MSTFVDVELMFPRMPPFDGPNEPAFGAVGTALTSTTERAAWVFQVTKSGTLKRFHFRVQTAASPVDVRASFQTVGTDGFPNTTESQYRDVSSGSISAGAWVTPGIMTDDGTDTGVKRTVTAGDWLGCVVRCLSAGSVAFSRPSLAQSESGTLSAPYWAYHTGGSWASKESRCGAILLEYDDGTYAELDAIELFPFHAFTGTSFASNSTPDERGILWTPTFTCKVRGGWYYGSANNVVDAVLYDGTSPLCTISIDPDTNTKGSSSFRRSVIFDAQYTLTAGNPYRLILKPTSTSAISLVSFDVASAGYLAAFAGGTAIQHTERTDGGSFSQTSTRRSFMGFHISAIQTDPGGGALLVHPGMAGGMRG